MFNKFVNIKTDRADTFVLGRKATYFPLAHWSSRGCRGSATCTCRHRLLVCNSAQDLTHNDVMIVDTI